MSEQNTATLEENFEKIEALLEGLERNDISIEEAFLKYREGVELLRLCDEQIDRVDKMVLKLSSNGDTEEFEMLQKDKNVSE